MTIDESNKQIQSSLLDLTQDLELLQKLVIEQRLREEDLKVNEFDAEASLQNHTSEHLQILRKKTEEVQSLSYLVSALIELDKQIVQSHADTLMMIKERCESVLSSLLESVDALETRENIHKSNALKEE